MDVNLAGKRAIVLAASRGLGFACAMELARAGCDVTICSRSEEKINAAAQQIKSETGARVNSVVCNVDDEAPIKAAVASAVAQFGGLEIAIHNAGGPPFGGFQATDDEKWFQAFKQNLMSFVWMSRAAIPEMRKAGYGRIIAITAGSIKAPIPNMVLSNTMRPGVLGVAKTLARELAPDNILVNVIAPGMLYTERIDELNQARAVNEGRPVEEIFQAASSTIPLGRMGEPRELANLAVFFASEAASYITGTAVQVDGGSINTLH